MFKARGARASAWICHDVGISQHRAGPGTASPIVIAGAAANATEIDALDERPPLHHEGRRAHVPYVDDDPAEAAMAAMGRFMDAVVKVTASRTSDIAYPQETQGWILVLPALLLTLLSAHQICSTVCCSDTAQG